MNEKTIIETDAYIQLFECLQELIENQGKLTFFQQKEIEDRLDYLSWRIYKEPIGEEFYRKSLEAWEKLLNKIALVIEGRLLKLNGESLFNRKVEKQEINIYQGLTDYRGNSKELIS